MRAPSLTEANIKHLRESIEPVVPELRAADCKTPEQWAQWARERRAYEDPCGYERTRY